ncbi:DUF6053 domain-containing protein [Lysobacter enzymogenes]|uniref:DUF6053 domain-containing protein n=1 Tax=Lysobacter enzymogenes TaxID=69 RepID=UPI003D18893E
MSPREASGRSLPINESRASAFIAGGVRRSGGGRGCACVGLLGSAASGDACGPGRRLRENVTAATAVVGGASAPMLLAQVAVRFRAIRQKGIGAEAPPTTAGSAGGLTPSRARS